jgi:hypothetical protein
MFMSPGFERTFLFIGFKLVNLVSADTARVQNRGCSFISE